MNILCSAFGEHDGISARQSLIRSALLPGRFQLHFHFPIQPQMVLGYAPSHRILRKRHRIDRLVIVLEHRHVRFDRIQIVVQAADQLLLRALHETQRRHVFGPDEAAPAEIVFLRERHHEEGAERQVTVAGALKVVDKQQEEILEGDGAFVGGTHFYN